MKAFYFYAINKITENENNPDILDIYYGHADKFPLYIHLDEAEAFMKTILTSDERLAKEITDHEIHQFIQKNGVPVLVNH